MNSIYNYTIKELEDLLLTLNFKKFGASQLYDWIYKKNVVVKEIREAHNLEKMYRNGAFKEN